MYHIPNTDLIAMDESEYLEHFGIKGMRWGHRKQRISTDKTSTTHWTPEQKKKAKIIAAVAFGSAMAIGAAYVAKKTKFQMDELSFNASVVDKHLKNKDILDTVVPKDTSFSRISKSLETGISGSEYATYKKHDVDWYTAHWAGDYKIKYSALSDTKIASGKTFIDTMSSSIKSQKTRKLAMDQYKAMNPGVHMSTTKKLAYRLSSPDTVAKALYNRQEGRTFKGPLTDKAFNNLKKRGYSGLTDTHDTSALAEHATILFDNSHFKTNSTKITSSMIDEARRRLGER